MNQISASGKLECISNTKNHWTVAVSTIWDQYYKTDFAVKLRLNFDAWFEFVPSTTLSLWSYTNATYEADENMYWFELTFLL